MVMHIDSEALLSRKATAEALTARGFATAEATLVTKASRGGGPPYRRWGRSTLYRWGDVLDWAEGRLSSPRGASEGAGQAATQPEALQAA
jgi:hypothetical protein